MRNSLIILSSILVTVGCSNFNQIGDTVDTQSAISVKDAYQIYQEKGTEQFTVFGRVKEVCQAEGCWFSYDLHDKIVVVDFDEKFTVPKGIARKDLYAVGKFYQDTSWNEDATDSTTATYSLNTKFLATGVRFK